MLGHNRRMTGAQCLADMLDGYGVTHVFMVPAVLRRTLAEMERRTAIKRIHAGYAAQQGVLGRAAVVAINGWNRLMVAFRIPPAVARRD